jgi:ech hydrogenase subunit F
MPGMNKIILKNLFKKPVTRKYPFEKREPFPDGRGKMVFARMENCIFCGLCSKNCPGKAIKVDKLSKTNTVDPLKCVQCGYCADACPKDVIDMVTEYNEPRYKKGTISATQTTKAQLSTSDKENKAETK